MQKEEMEPEVRLARADVRLDELLVEQRTAADVAHVVGETDSGQQGWR